MKRGFILGRFDFHTETSKKTSAGGVVVESYADPNLNPCLVSLHTKFHMSLCHLIRCIEIKGTIVHKINEIKNSKNWEVAWQSWQAGYSSHGN